MQPALDRIISVEEYLLMEAKSSTKHEYLNGQIFAMTGGTLRHNVISSNIFSLLNSFLRGTPCRAYMGDVKVRIEEVNCFYYPDVLVACGEADDTKVYVESPVLIVEVLSPSTAQSDRREKLVNYRLLPSLKEYIIVHQRRKRIQVFTKNDTREWCSTVVKEKLTVSSLPKGSIEFDVDEIYEGTGLNRIGGTVREPELDDDDLVDADLDW